jgi:hypothetical protein
MVAAGAGTALVFHYVPLHDFVEYWTAAHVLVNRQDPYSLEAMMKAQQAMGWSEPEPLMVMSPPQFLPFLIPLGFFQSYVLARVIWLCVSVAMLVFEISTLWSLYRGPSSRRWVAIGAAALFYPVWHCLAVAQIAPLLLLGIVGFLWLEQRGHLFLAGCALALTSAKPHLFYLVWLAVLLWSVREREIRVIIGAGVSIAAALGGALLIDPAALSQYIALARSDYIWVYNSGAGGVLTSLLGQKGHLLQFVPMLPGLIGLAWYWDKYRDQWRWRDRLPVVLTISVLTAAYGWPFNEVVLLVPVIMIAVESTYRPEMRDAVATWLGATFVGSLAVVLRYGDAPGMIICAVCVLGCLIFDALSTRARLRETHSGTNFYRFVDAIRRLRSESGQ